MPLELYGPRMRNTALFLSTALLTLTAAVGCDYETVAALQSPTAPESVAIESDTSVVFSDALTGLVQRVDIDTGATSVITALPLGQCPPNPFPPILGAVAIDDQGFIYVNANTCDVADRGVYKIDPVTGAASVHVPLAPNVLANGLAIADDQLFIVDTFSDTLLSAPLSGGPASAFSSSPLFAPTGDVFDPTPGTPGDEVPLPGGNGLQRYDDDNLVLANSSSGDLVLVPLDGSTPTLLTNTQPGCDDIAVDVKKNILCTTDAFQTLVVVDPHGNTHLVFDGLADPNSKRFAPLDGPTAVTCEVGGRNCYVSNASFPFFPPTGAGPSIGSFKWKYKGAAR